MIYWLGSGHEWELDEDVWQLRRRGERVAIQPKILALLFQLARSRATGTRTCSGRLSP
ncbi:MAG: hypothetical protein WEF50_06985 [Myxococcota bacterium]